jgi:hypothetical protein
MSQSRCHYTTTGDYICSKNKSIERFSNAKQKICNDLKNKVFTSSDKDYNMANVHTYRSVCKNNECYNPEELRQVPSSKAEKICETCCPPAPRNKNDVYAKEAQLRREYCIADCRGIDKSKLSCKYDQAKYDELASYNGISCLTKSLGRKKINDKNTCEYRNVMNNCLIESKIAAEIEKNKKQKPN